MSIGKSGRIVIEIDPDLKKKLYSELTLQGLSLKDWFVMSTHNYLTSKDNINSISKKDNSEE